MLQTLSLETKNVINEVNDAREYYFFAKFQSESAWKTYQHFIDEDPRWINPNARDEEIEKYRNQCNEYLAWANFYELELKEAWHRLDKAKTKLLELQED